MCPCQQHKKTLAAQMPVQRKSRRLFLFMIPLVIFTLAFTLLPAQNRSEEYLSVKNWNLPEEAVIMTNLQMKDKILYQQDMPFSGWAYELYPEGKILRASEFFRGYQHGLSLLWYPDGNPQMSATYRNGALHGRFLGWYQNGSMIYDMFINRGTYASDNLFEGDDLRQEEAETFEREGSTDDSTRE